MLKEARSEMLFIMGTKFIRDDFTNRADLNTYTVKQTMRLYIYKETFLNYYPMEYRNVIKAIN